MNSPKFLNYETRPLKFTERKMLLACLQRICNYYGNDYQYIGLGGLAFTDFKLFHKELHINNLYSIEGGKFSGERLAFNSPYSFIKILKTNTTDAFNKIDLTKKSLIWLDYDGALENYMFDDIQALFKKLPAGSVYIFSCNRELKENKTKKEYTKEEFREEFGNRTPFKIDNQDFSIERSSLTIRKMLKAEIETILQERNLIEDSELEFKQIFNIHYQENRGAKMFTYGGVLTKKATLIDEFGLKAFDFLTLDECTFELVVPNITRKEFELIDKNLNEHEKLLAQNIVAKDDVEKYQKIYKYVPHFYDIRI
ncbi:MAG: O-methyltransferase [Salinivirgaceae bacterium]|jgi:hypothetical protein